MGRGQRMGGVIERWGGTGWVEQGRIVKRVGGAGWVETVNISVVRQLTWGMWPKFPLKVLDSLLSCHCASGDELRCVSCLSCFSSPSCVHLVQFGVLALTRAGCGGSINIESPQL